MHTSLLRVIGRRSTDETRGVPQGRIRPTPLARPSGSRGLSRAERKSFNGITTAGTTVRPPGRQGWCWTPRPESTRFVRVGDHRQLRPAPRRCRSPGNARRWTAPHGWPAASPASTIAPNTPHGGPKSTAFPNRSGSTACGVLAQSERCAKSVLVKRIIRASGVLRGLTSCRYSWPMVGGTLQSVTSHESVLLVDAALL